METKRQAAIGWIFLIGMLFFGIPIPGTMGSLPEASGSMMMMGMPGEPPDFCVPTIMSVQNGPWDAPATWDLGRIPNAGDNVEIHHTVTLRTTDAIAWTVCVHDGKLIFQPNVNTRLTVVHLQVMHDMTTGMMGELEIGTPTTPIAANVTAEVIFRDVPLNTGMIDSTTGQYMPPATGVPDPEQFGNGLIGHGKVTIHGAIKDPTFVRLAAEPVAGNITLTLSQPVTGWLPGDRLILPDTRQLPMNVTKRTSPQWETPTLASVSNNGKVLTLTSPLQFDHRGAYNPDGTPAVLANGERLLPHVGNLTRNVVFRSENPAGTRGHVIFMHRAEADIRYALFKDLGRTDALRILDLTTYDATGNVTHVGKNQIGRYALHAHHLMGPTTLPASGCQYEFEGNAIDGDPKWGITIHDSHYGCIDKNVVYNAVGSGIVTEAGSEYRNVIEGNFIVRSEGSGQDPFVRTDKALPLKKGFVDFAYEGAGLWFHGSLNTVRNNVMADAQFASLSVVHFGSPPGLRIPRYPGADTVNGQQGVDYTVTATPSQVPIDFSGNEGYGCANISVYLWGVGLGANRYSLTNTVSWHDRNLSFIGPYSDKVEFDGFDAVGDASLLATGQGAWGISGDTLDPILRRLNIRGMQVGLSLENGPKVIEDSTFANVKNVVLKKQKNPTRPDFLINVRFIPIPGYPLYSVERVWVASFGQGATFTVVAPEQVYVYDYQQVHGNNLELAFNPQQDPNFIVPQTDPVKKIIGSPEAGLTNAQNWAKYGIAIAGKVAPCTTTLPEFPNTFVCPLPPDPNPPVISAISVTVFSQGTAATITWATDEFADGQVEYGQTAAYGNVVSSPGYLTNHNISFRGLTPGTLYHYRIKSKDPAGNVAVTGDLTFTT